MSEDDSDAPDWGPVTAPELEDIERLAHAAIDFPPAPELPMRWLALPPIRPTAGTPS
jgi:hypothetical protein